MSTSEIGAGKERVRFKLFRFLSVVLIIVGSYYLIDFLYIFFVKKATDFSELGRGICFMALGILCYLRPLIFVGKKGSS